MERMTTLMMATSQWSCYSVWVRMMMRTTTTTAQTAPTMVMFYREGNAQKKGRKMLATGNMSIEMGPFTKHRLKICETNLLLAVLCLFSSNQRQVFQNRENIHTPKNFKYTQTHLK